jgi:large subunit ribosomal protein L35
MPKMKTKRALAKRVKVTGSGQLKRKSAYTSHLAPHKTTKQKRHLRKASLVSKSDYKREKILIQG